MNTETLAEAVAREYAGQPDRPTPADVAAAERELHQLKRERRAAETPAQRWQREQEQGT
jgi:hypothetical protein